MNELTKTFDITACVGWEEAKNSLVEMSPLHDLWNRSNTDWALENITISMGGATPIRKLRQISAEVEHRSLAMEGAKYSILRKNAEIKEFKRRLKEDVLTSFEREMIEIDIAEKEGQITATVRKFSGAIKDVTQLKRCYDEIVSANGIPTNEEIEKEAHRSSLIRALMQSIRDLRQSRIISAGNQEFLEQCGVNPTTVFVRLVGFIKEEHDNMYTGTDELTSFVFSLADDLISTEKNMGDLKSV